MLQVDRAWFVTPLVKDQVLYPMLDMMNTKNIAQVRVNNVMIPLKVKKIDGKRYIDISLYCKNYPDVKEGTLTLLVDKK